jgi:hypothetical protein
MRAIKHEEAQVKMVRLVRQLVRQIVVLLMLAVVPMGAFAQRGRGQGQDKRPPKEPVKVIENRKDKPPPPKNDRPKGDNKKRP